MDRKDLLKKAGFSEFYLKLLEEIDFKSDKIDLPVFSNDVADFESQDTDKIELHQPINYFDPHIIIG